MLAMATTDDRAVGATPTGEWRCVRCGRYLGRVIGAIFHEPNGDRSALPVIRHCPRCKRRNVRLQ